MLIAVLFLVVGIGLVLYAVRRLQALWINQTETGRVPRRGLRTLGAALGLFCGFLLCYLGGMAVLTRLLAGIS